MLVLVLHLCQAPWASAPLPGRGLLPLLPLLVQLCPVAEVRPRLLNYSTAHALLLPEDITGWGKQAVWSALCLWVFLVCMHRSAPGLLSLSAPSTQLPCPCPVVLVSSPEHRPALPAVEPRPSLQPLTPGSTAVSFPPLGPWQSVVVVRPQEGAEVSPGPMDVATVDPHLCLEDT